MNIGNQSGPVAWRTQSADSGASAPISQSFNNNGDHLIAVVLWTDVGAITKGAITYAGQAPSRQIGSDVSLDAGNTIMSLYEWDSPAQGSNLFAANGSGTTSHLAILACCLSIIGWGANGTPTTPATGTSATSATGNITNAAGSILLAAMCAGGQTDGVDANAPNVGTFGNTLSARLAGTAQTAGDNIGVFTFAADGTTRNMQATQTSASWGAIGVELKAGAPTVFDMVSVAKFGGRPAGFKPGGAR